MDEEKAAELFAEFKLRHLEHFDKSETDFFWFPSEVKKPVKVLNAERRGTDPFLDLRIDLRHPNNKIINKISAIADEHRKRIKSHLDDIVHDNEWILFKWHYIDQYKKHIKNFKEQYNRRIRDPEWYEKQLAVWDLKRENKDLTWLEIAKQLGIDKEKRKECLKDNIPYNDSMARDRARTYFDGAKKNIEYGPPWAPGFDDEVWE